MLVIVHQSLCQSLSVPNDVAELILILIFCKISCLSVYKEVRTY